MQLVQKMVQNQAKIVQLAPATNEKSLCLQQLHRLFYCSCQVEDYYKLPGGKKTTTKKNRIRAAAFFLSKILTLELTRLTMAPRV